MAAMDPKYKRWIRRISFWLGIPAAVLLVLVLLAWSVMIRMPGKSFAGPLPPASPHESALGEQLRSDVERLAGTIGERNLEHAPALDAAAAFIESSLTDVGHEVRRQSFDVDGKTCHNLEVEVAGADRATEIVVVGAHFDTAPGAPGADDNASGVAALLALARAFAHQQPIRTLRLVAFTNEEPPHFQMDSMGSFVYARRCRERNENIVAMLSLETVGYFSDASDSQKYPAIFSVCYPSKGNFIAFVGNVGSRQLVRETIGSFRRHARFPSEGGAVPGFIDGVGWSDHWAFWHFGYPAVMVTDTAPFRNPHYHTRGDTPGTLDFDRMGRVVDGLRQVVADLTE